MNSDPKPQSATDQTPGEPAPADAPSPEQDVAQDITEEERAALFRETLQSLQEAFSVPDDEWESGTTTELHLNAAEAASETETPQ